MILTLLSCSRDYIEMPVDEESDLTPYEVSSSYTSVDYIQFDLNYNDLLIDSASMRYDTLESPQTTYDGQSVFVDIYQGTSFTHTSLSPNTRYYYSLFYAYVDSDFTHSISYTYNTFTYFEGMHQTLTELISYIDNKGRGFELIISGETMDLYDDTSILGSIDGILITSLIWDDVDSESPSKDANLAKIESFTSNYTYDVFAVDYSTEIGNLETSRSTFPTYEIVGFNRFLSALNMADLSVLSAPYLENPNNIATLSDVQNFIFLDQPIDNMVTQLQNLTHDLIIMTPFSSYPINSLGDIYSSSDIISLQTKPNGTLGTEKRLVYAYLDIGLAIKSSYYWDISWVDANSYPDWIIDGYDSSITDYIIKYWSVDWKTILYAMVDAISENGYDGIVLGGTHHYKNFPIDGD